jgi:hypothetical protein
MIEARTHQFFTSVNGRRAEVEVVRQQGREPYVRSVPDNTRVDNLLSLPEIYF